MLPLQLLNASQSSPVLVELKNGETFNGHLLNCDNWMNVNLQTVIKTSQDGKRFFKMNEIYIKGNTIKYLRIQEEILNRVVVEEQEQSSNRGRGRGRSSRGSRGGRGGRGGRGTRGVKKAQKD